MFSIYKDKIMVRTETHFLRVPALEVSQPLGVFYVTKLKARDLLKLTFVDPLHATGEARDDSYPLSGVQRKEKPERLKAIAHFIESADAAFPNSIILGANYDKDWQLVEDDERRWRLELPDPNGCLQLVIPTQHKVARIVDGQHRLNAFRYAPERGDMELLCAVYLDLPNTFQAFLFATINFNQKRVDRSLAYELFGIGLNEEDPHTWSPEKTAVYICRRLNVEPDSPFHQRIIVAAQNEDVLFRNKRVADWAISTATIVDGILKLFSSKPQEDKDRMYKKMSEERSRGDLEDDGSPLRKLYLGLNDLGIYTIVANFFVGVQNALWVNAGDRSPLKKTVGIQALFEVLYILMKESKGKSVDVSVTAFSNRLMSAAALPFDDGFFESSGRGRTRLKNCIAVKMDLITLEPLRRSEDFREYRRILNLP
jgi:DNA phosphorothioation-associated DGQHR protein 1